MCMNDNSAHIILTDPATSRDVFFMKCTAIPSGVPGERINGLYVHVIDDIFCDGDGMIFGRDLPENAGELPALWEDFLDTNQSTLDSVRFSE